MFGQERGAGVTEAAIRKAVQSKDNPADLINVALDELVRQRCELPGYEAGVLWPDSDPALHDNGTGITPGSGPGCVP
ncbi:hypothetical protein ACQP25_24525 [Microtetraspora malaysiensis]|uniref:hypothetical protein n=1 Tax=Microtetraspora malaysiensis TaxID=161358 RepID=UPI003D94F01C